jgi:gluconolactonase
VRSAGAGLALLVTGVVALGAVAEEPTRVGIVAHDARFDVLVPPDAELEQVASGLSWTEGPLWRPGEEALWFSDVTRNAVLRWSARDGVRALFAPSGYTGSAPFRGAEPGSNGLALDPQGRLLLCQHGDRRVARREDDGRLTSVADRWQGKRLNSPNDLVVHSSGAVYFTDPPFGLPRAFDDPAKELPFQGVYRVSPDGELQLVADGIRAPNGVALSPDERTLYVSDVDPARAAWLAFDVREDGTLVGERIFHDATRWREDPFYGPDGIEVDRAGNVFGARPGGISVFAPDGTHLGDVETGTPVSNLAWAEDGATLYLTAGRSIYRLRLGAAGRSP